MAIVGLTMVGPTPSADAAVLGGNGVWGFNSPSVVTCRYLDSWNQLRTETPPPVAYAYNRTAGGGNDWQMVRYRVFYVDAMTNQTVASTGWSGYSWAGDNQTATWTGGPAIQSFNASARIRVETRIEFYNRYGAYDGYIAHSANQYNFHNGYTTYPVIVRDFCLKTFAY